MSVMKFGIEEWQKLYNSLVLYQQSNDLQSRIKTINEEEIRERVELYKRLKEKKTETEIIEELIAEFVTKLAFVNDVTVVYQYEFNKDKKGTIDKPIDLKKPSLEVFSQKELFIQLGQINYNCVSNGGTNLLPQELYKKVKEIQLSVAYNIIYGSEDEETEALKEVI